MLMFDVFVREALYSNKRCLTQRPPLAVFGKACQKLFDPREIKISSCFQIHCSYFLWNVLVIEENVCLL